MCVNFFEVYAQSQLELCEARDLTLEYDYEY